VSEGNAGRARDISTIPMLSIWFLLEAGVSVREEGSGSLTYQIADISLSVGWKQLSDHIREKRLMYLHPNNLRESFRRDGILAKIQHLTQTERQRVVREIYGSNRRADLKTSKFWEIFRNR
jgi:hypothetical protein